MLSSAFKQDPQEHKDEPLIPEVYLDFPSQRLYYLSLGALCQVCIVFTLVYHSSPTRDSEYQVI